MSGNQNSKSDKKNAYTTRKNTDDSSTRGAGRFGLRSTTGAGQTLVVEELQEITTAEKGRNYLEGRSLLVPAGTPITTAMVASCLHQICIAAEMPPVILNAIRSVAYLVEELDVDNMNQRMHDGLNAELENFTTEHRQLTEQLGEITRTVDTRIRDLESMVTRLSQTATPTTQEPSQATTAAAAWSSNRTYSQVLTQPPPDTDPRMIARHGIRQRQIMVEGVAPDSKIGKMDEKSRREEINKILKALAGEGVQARTVVKQAKGGILVEMDSDFGAGWMRSEANAGAFCKEIGSEVKVKERSYNLIAMFAPLSAEPESKTFVEEVEEANRLERGTIRAMRWAKPIARRRPEQRWAHIIITLSNADEANRILALGLHIAHKKVVVEKCKKEPIRCLKCQGWNHFARDCSNETVCGHCGERGHATSQCPNSKTKKCHNCGTDDHSSYDRHCPTFRKKAADYDKSNPENELPFIPTGQPWTWARSRDQHKPDVSLERRQAPPPITERAGSQRTQRRTVSTKIVSTGPNGRPLERSRWDRQMEEEDERIAREQRAGEEPQENQLNSQSPQTQRADNFFLTGTNKDSNQGGQRSSGNEKDDFEWGEGSYRAANQVFN